MSKQPKIKVVYQVCQGVNRRKVFRREVPSDFICDQKDEFFSRVRDARRFANAEAWCGIFNTRDSALKNEYREHIRENNVKVKSLRLLKLGEQDPYMGGGRNGYGEWEP